MTRLAINTDQAPQPAGGYSQGVVANGFLYTAGFGPHDPVTGVVDGDIAEQTRKTLANVTAVLDEHGLGLGDVVKATVHLQNLDRDFPAFDQAYRELFDAPYPVRTTVGSQLAGILVEIDVVAVFPQ